MKGSDAETACEGKRYAEQEATGRGDAKDKVWRIRRRENPNEQRKAGEEEDTRAGN